MKKTTIALNALIIMTCLMLSSCAAMFAPQKANIILYESPKDLVITENGVNIPIEQVTSHGKQTGLSGYEGSYVTFYYTSGIKLNKKVSHNLELKSGGKTSKLELKSKTAGAWIWLDLITSGPFGIIIDLASKSAKILNPIEIDVPALLKGEKMRGKKELRKNLRKSLEK